jgi:hypothetical protein
VVAGETGVFFQDQNVSSLIKAIEEFEKLSFDPLRVRKNAERFSSERFRREFAALIEREWSRFKERL